MAVKKKPHQVKPQMFLFLNGVFTVGCSNSRTCKTFPNPNFIEMGDGFVNCHYLRKSQLQNAHLGLLSSSVLKMCVGTQDWLLFSELLRTAQTPFSSSYGVERNNGKIVLLILKPFPVFRIVKNICKYIMGSIKGKP